MKNKQFERKIDAYSHYSFPELVRFLENKSGHTHPFGSLFSNTKALIDANARIDLMDSLGIEKNILVPLPELGMTPKVERDPSLCLQAAQICNNMMADLVAKYPNRFLGVAMIPTANSEVMVKELERAVRQLKLVGGVIGTTNELMAPDHPSFEPLYAKLAELDVPLYLHPACSPLSPEYIGEQGGSKYQYFQAFSWLNDSTLAMHRIVFSGVFERYPNLKVVIHHHGAIIPYFVGRLEVGIRYFEKNAGCKYEAKVQAPYAEHYKKFFIDTATQYYNPAALQIAVDFFGPEHVLFGTDLPMSASEGFDMYSDAEKSIDDLTLTDEQRKMIYYKNAERIFKI